MKLTKFDLNKAIAEQLKALNVYKGRDGQIIYTSDVPRYCNNWNDLMPLVVEHKIDLEFADIDVTEEIVRAQGFIWDGGDITHHYEVINKSPQRALAECLLKVLENKKMRLSTELSNIIRRRFVGVKGQEEAVKELNGIVVKMQKGESSIHDASDLSERLDKMNKLEQS
jgi:hypothetical protein